MWHVNVDRIDILRGPGRDAWIGIRDLIANKGPKQAHFVLRTAASESSFRRALTISKVEVIGHEVRFEALIDKRTVSGFMSLNNGKGFMLPQ